MLFRLNNETKSENVRNLKVNKHTNSQSSKQQYEISSVYKAENVEETISESSSSDDIETNYGKIGSFDVPKEFQGTWYMALENGKIIDLRISEHTINEDLLFIKDPNFQVASDDPRVKDFPSDIQSWYDTKLVYYKGDKVISLVHWLLSGTDSFNYRLHNEDGNQVIVWVHGPLSERCVFFLRLLN